MATIDNERPVFLCGNCEQWCTDVKADRQPLRGATVFTVNHHGRTYRREMNGSEQASIVASSVPAVDVCGWNQTATHQERRGDPVSGQPGFSQHNPLLFCGKCDCRMNRHAAYLNQDDRSADFAVSCHGQMYVLNLDENKRWLMMGDNRASGTTGEPQRLDVCDQRGKQYPHRAPRHEDAKGLVGTHIAPSGVVFDPVAPGPKPNNHPAPQPITAATSDEMDALADRSRAEAHGVDLRQQFISNGQIQGSVLVAGVRHYWNPFYGQYTTRRPTGPPAKAPQHTPDPITGLTPAATSAMQEIATEMMRARREGGPVTEALANMAGSLSASSLDRLDMAPNGTDLRIMVSAFDGTLVKRINEGGTLYEWSLPAQRYERVDLITASPALAFLPAPQSIVLPPARSRRIILED